MDTTRNRSAVLAKFLRAAVADVRRYGRPTWRSVFLGGRFTTAVESIDTVAAELEAVATGRDLPPPPDPAGPNLGEVLR